MKKLYKIMLVALFSILCFVPLSVFAEEESSTFIFTDDTSSLSSSQLSVLNDILSTQPDNVAFVQNISNGFIYYTYDAYSYDYNTDRVYFNNYYRLGANETTPTFVETSNSWALAGSALRSYYCCIDSYHYYPNVSVYVSVSSSGGGSVSQNYFLVPYMDFITIEAYPSPGYEFDFWEINSPAGFSGDRGSYSPFFFQIEYPLNVIAHFKYTGVITPTPTPTPSPDEPSYEMNPDFNHLLSNPSIASLVQYAVNDLNSNTWWIERELYYYEPASCPSGSTPSYSTFGYVERFVLYNYTSSGLTAIADSINHQGQSSLGCTVSSSETKVIIPDLESSPRISETLFYGFDLFEVPSADFYRLLAEIKNAILDSGSSSSVNVLNNNIVSGTEASQNASSSIDSTTSSLNSSATQYEQFESQFNSSLTSSLDNIDVNSINLVNSNDFVKTASWVKVQFDDILDSSGIYKTAISFVLIIGLALLLLGRRL